MPENGQTAGSKLFTLATTLFHRNRLASLAGKTFEGNRDLYKELGYKRTIEFQDYRERYFRGGMAGRIVDIPAATTWRNQPSVIAKKASRNLKVNDQFNEAWIKLAERLKIFHYLERIDKASGIGKYGVLLVGMAGAQALDTPARKVTKPEDILYLAPYTEGNAEIKTFVNKPEDSRFGLPESYKLSISRDPNDTAVTSSKIKNVEVHHSRILHIAEGLLEDEIFGQPRMEKVWNYLDDLDKVVGGTSEAVWKTVDRGIQFDVDKDMELSEEDEAAFSDEIDDYMHKLKRYFRTRGITANVLGSGSDVPDPTGAFKVITSLVAGTTGIPLRILFGSEQGQLASSQDEKNFNARIGERQKSFAEPQILRPFVDMMIGVKALPKPSNGYDVKWPDLSIVTLKEKADVAARAAQAIRNVSAQDSEHIVMGGEEFKKMFLDLGN